MLAAAPQTGLCTLAAHLGTMGAAERSQAPSRRSSTLRRGQPPVVCGSCGRTRREEAVGGAEPAAAAAVGGRWSAALVLSTSRRTLAGTACFVILSHSAPAAAVRRGSVGAGPGFGFAVEGRGPRPRLENPRENEQCEGTQLVERKSKILSNAKDERRYRRLD